MLKKHTITSFVNCFLFIATSVAADDGNFEDAERRISELLDSYSQKCEQESLLSDIDAYFRSGKKNENKACKATLLNEQVTSILSSINDTTIKDSAYRAWYDYTLTSIRPEHENDRFTRGSMQGKFMEKRAASDMVTRSDGKDSTSRILTVKGFQTLNSK